MAGGKPKAYDLFCGLGGWTEGLLAEGYDVTGYDIEEHVYGDERYPARLVVRDVLSIHGSEFAHADLIVASPPCQEYSYMAMPWGRAKQIARALRGEDVFPEGYRGSRTLAELTALFDACFRIQREASEAGGRHIPMVVENVKGAQPWVGRSAYNFGSYHLWGDMPALMPRPRGEGVKVGGMGWYPPEDPRHQVGAAFNPGAQGAAFSAAREGRKVAGFRFDGSGGSFQTASVSAHGLGIDGAAEGRKQRGSGREWFAGEGTIGRTTSSKSPARKAASAKIAKIPFALSSHIARVYLPERVSEAA